VQPKNYHDDLVVRNGDVIGLGRIVFWEQGVKMGYGSQRGSHYQHVKGFVATQQH